MFLNYILPVLISRFLYGERHLPESAAGLWFRKRVEETGHLAADPLTDLKVFCCRDCVGGPFSVIDALVAG